ncbi:MAG: helix-turn-helix transcriptional regulator [Nocardioidaceae bacterium]
MGSWVSERDHRRGWSVVAACADVRNRSELIAQLLPQLQPLLRSKEVSSATIDLSRSLVTASHGYPTLTADLPEAVAVWRARPLDHPWTMHYLKRKSDATMLVSDLFPGTRLLRLPYYADFYRPKGVRYAAYCVIAHAGPSVVGVGAGRRTKDFTDRERDLLDHLRRPMGALWHLAFAREQLHHLGQPHRFSAASTAERPPTFVRGRFDQLTSRENQVVALLIRGYDNRAIALTLGVSVKAVEQHLTHVFQKVGVDSRIRLVLALTAPRPNA